MLPSVSGKLGLGESGASWGQGGVSGENGAQGVWD